jgi:CheY-like chemotaxis protein
MPLIALVVDDSMLIRHTVCRYLEDRGFAVETAANGQDALESLKRIKPNLIITDIRMPKMNGSELITALKNNPGTATIPVVVVTGKQHAEKEMRGDYAIFKDIEIEDQLGKALQALLGFSAAAGK